METLMGRIEHISVLCISAPCGCLMHFLYSARLLWNIQDDFHSNCWWCSVWEQLCVWSVVWNCSNTHTHTQQHIYTNTLPCRVNSFVSFHTWKSGILHMSYVLEHVHVCQGYNEPCTPECTLRPSLHSHTQTHTDTQGWNASKPGNQQIINQQISIQFGHHRSGLTFLLCSWKEGLCGERGAEEERKKERKKLYIVGHFFSSSIKTGGLHINIYVHRGYYYCDESCGQVLVIVNS